MLADVTPLSMAPRQQQTNLDHTKTPQGFLQNNKQIWNLYKPGMHGAGFLDALASLKTMLDID